MNNTRTAIAVRRQGPNRILVALAAGWMILSLAIGGAIAADAGPDPDARAGVTRTTQH